MTLRQAIAKFGRIGTVTLITAASVFLSVVICMTFYSIFNIPWNVENFTIAIVAPLLIAPTVCWYAIGLLIELHHMEEKMRHLATYDSLTKVLNRGAFIAQTEQLIKLASRSSLPVSLLYLDIDNFKLINDTYGHNAGDEILKTLGTLLNSCKRNSDIAARFGGEEFILLLPATDHEGAVQFAQKLQQDICSTKVLIHCSEINFTVSIGLVSCSLTHKIDFETFYKHADRALYQAKARGKNCFELVVLENSTYVEL